VRMVLEPRDQIRGAFWRDGGRVHPIEPCRPQRYLSSVMSVNSSPATYPPIPNASFASLFLSFSIAANFTFNYTHSSLRLTAIASVLVSPCLRL